MESPLLALHCCDEPLVGVDQYFVLSAYCLRRPPMVAGYPTVFFPLCVEHGLCLVAGRARLGQFLLAAEPLLGPELCGRYRPCRLPRGGLRRGRQRPALELPRIVGLATGVPGLVEGGGRTRASRPTVKTATLFCHALLPTEAQEHGTRRVVHGTSGAARWSRVPFRRLALRRPHMANDLSGYGPSDVAWIRLRASAM